MIKNFFRRIKFTYQIYKYGFSDEDCWDVGSHICRILPPMLRKLQKGCGCPSELFDNTRINDECWKWNEILEEMAQGFEAGIYIKNRGGLSTKRNKDGGYEFYIDKEKDEQLSKKFNRGLELLSKYFFGLWD